MKFNLADREKYLDSLKQLFGKTISDEVKVLRETQRESVNRSNNESEGKVK